MPTAARALPCADALTRPVAYLVNASLETSAASLSVNLMPQLLAKTLIAALLTVECSGVPLWLASQQLLVPPISS